MSKKPLNVKSENLLVTKRGIEIEGKAATQLAGLLISHRDQVIASVRRIDNNLSPGDIYLDELGRVVVRSARIQKMAYEAVRIGATPGNPKGLGRLIKRTGGKIGSELISKAEYQQVSGLSSPISPIVGGGSPIHEANFVCQGHGTQPGPEDDSLDIFCGEWDEILEDETDFNCFCGWASG